MVMVKMGRVKNGMMNEMVPTNEKLRLRKKNLLISLIKIHNFDYWIIFTCSF
jgi:N-acetylmuramic acid 6-phosphate (MurNAc-6-P) etherase